jgi:hypothetical protein
MMYSGPKRGSNLVNADRGTIAPVQAGVDVRDRHALFECFVAIDFDKLLRNARQEGRIDPGNFRAFARGGHELVDVRSQIRLPPRSSSTNVKPPEVPTPGMAGGEKLMAAPCGSFHSQLLVTQGKLTPPSGFGVMTLRVAALQHSQTPGFIGFPTRGSR